MAELNERDTKLVQYLNEAYGKEKQLETALEAHIAMTTRAQYKKRLQQHLRETKAHGRDVKKRINNEGGDPLTSTPEEYAADIDKEESKWSALIKKLNLKVE